MKRSTLVLALTGLALIPVIAGAQEYRERDKARVEVAPHRTRVFSFNRARLGVTVQMKANEESDKIGAKIQSVVPDSPADQAGLEAGDIITRFNGTSLADAESEDDDMSGPGLKLIELAHELDEGDSVRVEYRRDGANRTATIVAAEVDQPFAMQFKAPGHEMPEFNFDGPNGRMFEMGPGPNMSFFFDGHGAGLGLVELNGDLGEYFGTSEGLLVTETPKDSAAALRAGDVILSIDGRKPTSVSQARRILGSYEDGETAKIEIMRKRQRLTVDWNVERPEFKMRHMEPTRERTHRM